MTEVYPRDSGVSLVIYSPFRLQSSSAILYFTSVPARPDRVCMSGVMSKDGLSLKGTGGDSALWSLFPDPVPSPLSHPTRESESHS